MLTFFDNFDCTMSNSCVADSCPLDPLSFTNSCHAVSVQKGKTNGGIKFCYWVPETVKKRNFTPF